MSEYSPALDREARRRLAIIRHVEEVTGNVAMTCRYYGISRQAYYIWYRRYAADGVDGLRTRSKRPKTIPNATHVDIVGKILHLRQHYHFGPEKIVMYLKRYWSRPPRGTGPASQLPAVQRAELRASVARHRHCSSPAACASRSCRSRTRVR
jgi:transposase-like protein